MPAALSEGLPPAESSKLTCILGDLLIHLWGKEVTEHPDSRSPEGKPLPLTVLLAAGRAARGSCAVSVSFGIPMAFLPAARRYSLGGAGPLDGATARGKGQRDS